MPETMAIYGVHGSEKNMLNNKKNEKKKILLYKKFREKYIKNTCVIG